MPGKGSGGKMDFRKIILDRLKELGVSDAALLVPPERKMGDFAFPCFALANRLKKSPAEAAKSLSSRIGRLEGISRVEQSGPYVNFFIDTAKLADSVLKRISTSGKDYGKKKRDERVMVEFSQANTHKAFHVGHLRGTSLGESLSRILRHSGCHVVKANYQGDTGAHVAKWLWCYMEYHAGKTPPPESQDAWIAGIYVEAVKRLEDDKSLQAEVDEVNRKLESRKDRKLHELWKKSRKWSLDSLEGIYRELGVGFDVYYFEGDMEEDARSISKRLVLEKIAQLDDSATVVDLSGDGLGVWVLLRKDGTTLYSAKDLALAERKFKEHRLDRSIYVVGMAQSLHFRQLFRTLELMQFSHAQHCRHLPFAEVRFPEGKMSSRTGENILYSELRGRVFEHARKEVEKRHPDWKAGELEQSAKDISIGAMKYSMLCQDPNKHIIFDIEKSIDFEGETGPYIQYAHARICSILRKHGKRPGPNADFSALKEEDEKTLLVYLMQFPCIVDEVSENLRVNALANYSLRLAQAFNEFYHRHHVLVEDSSLRKARILLVSCIRQVIALCLELMAIPAPERM